MLDELKLLVEMVAKLPSMALWVIAFFFAYKVVVVGSIYGVIRLGIERAHSWLTTPKEQMVEMRGMLDGVCISLAVGPLMNQIRRVIGKGITIQSNYIHESSVDWLRQAIDDKIAKDIAAELSKNTASRREKSVIGSHES
jgi:hypothetical protein